MACAMWGVYMRGYPKLSLVLVLPVVLQLTGLWRDRSVGCNVCWRRGLWSLQRHGSECFIALSKRCTVTPWIVYLAFTELPSGPAQDLWLFVDSVSREEWRQLRVRLALER